MITRTRWLLVGALAAAAFVASVSSATASSFTVSPGGNITAASQGLVTFSSAVLNTFCRVTLSGQLDRGPIAKQRLNQFGTITSGTTLCNNVDASTPVIATLLQLPWRLRYDTILGSLPDAVTGFLFWVNPAVFNLNVQGVANCTIVVNLQGALGVLTRVAGAARYATNLLRILTKRPDIITQNSGLCPSTGLTNGLVGDFSLTPRQTLTRLGS